MGTTQTPQTTQTHQAQPLRIGLIGAGWVTQHHLAGWRQHASRARVVSITDPHTALAQARASAFGIDQVFANAEQMLDRGDLDAVDVAAPRETLARPPRLTRRFLRTAFRSSKCAR